MRRRLCRLLVRGFPLRSSGAAPGLRRGRLCCGGRHPTMRDPGCAVLPLCFSVLRTANYEGFGKPPLPCPATERRLPPPAGNRRSFHLRQGYGGQVAAAALCSGPSLKISPILFALLVIPCQGLSPRHGRMRAGLMGARDRRRVPKIFRRRKSRVIPLVVSTLERPSAGMPSARHERPRGGASWKTGAKR
jgi:hypothetical protein